MFVHETVDRRGGIGRSVTRPRIKGTGDLWRPPARILELERGEDAPQPQHFFKASAEVIESIPETGLSVTSETPVS
jgi:hypothetical protein